MLRELSRVTIMALAGLVATLAFGGAAQAASEKVLYSFSGGIDGNGPTSAVVFDAAGSLYSTTQAGGSAGFGTVFKISPSSGGTWSENVLYSFLGGADGNTPSASVIFDKSGNLYGTTYFGGTAQLGTVFKLSSNPDGTWTETTIHTFSGLDGSNPTANLVFGAAGNLYGTTSTGGATDGGTAFELTPNGDGSWSEKVIFNFPNNTAGGADPYAGLTVDSSGNLYGITLYGGNKTLGNVFELSPSSTGWTIKNLHAFAGNPDGQYPEASVIFDTAGNLYSTTVAGGTATCSCGTVFRLTPSGSGWIEKTLHSFNGTPGNGPFAGLILDSANNLYGAAYETSTRIGGMIFEINLATGAFSDLHNFGGAGDGTGPLGTLILDSTGNLYGTTLSGGAFGAGTVYEVTP